MSRSHFLNMATRGLASSGGSIGLSAIIATSALLFSIVKYAGAGFLIYLGIRAMLDKAPIKLDDGTPAISAGRALRFQRSIRSR